MCSLRGQWWVLLVDEIEEGGKGGGGEAKKREVLFGLDGAEICAHHFRGWESGCWHSVNDSQPTYCNFARDLISRSESGKIILPLKNSKTFEKNIMIKPRINFHMSGGMMPKEAGKGEMKRRNWNSPKSIAHIPVPVAISRTLYIPPFISSISTR